MSHSHDTHEQAAHRHAAPTIPEVHDEAGDSPPWVPKLGIALGCALALYLLLLQVQAQQAASASGGADAAETAEADDTPATE